jgi:hypothetical protein
MKKHQLFIMQLPRGKFREIVRGVPLEPLLLELNEAQYTGILKANWNSSTCTLVFQNGLVILAEYPPYAGDAGWNAITRLGNQSVGGILSDLDAVQLRLVIEFNGPFLLSVPVTPGQGPAAAGRRPVPAGSPVPPRMTAPVPVPATGSLDQSRETGSFPARAAAAIRQDAVKAELPVPVPGGQPGHSTLTPAGSAGAARPPREESGRSPAVPSEVYPGGGGGSGPAPSPQAMDPATLASLEMSALDDMDVDHIATKVRKNARGIVKKLHLGHLMTEKDE